MLWYDFLIHYISTLIGLLFMIEMFNILTIRKKIPFKDIVLIFIISFLSLLNTLTNYTISRILVFYLLYVITIKLIFKEDWKRVIIGGLICYIIILFMEIICARFVNLVSISNAEELDNNSLFKLLISTLTMLTSLIIIYIKKIRYFLRKSLNVLVNSDFFIVLIIVGLIVLFLSFITFKNALNFTSVTYFILNMALFLLILGAFLISVVNLYNRNKLEKREEILLNFMKKNEYVIDRDRMIRHDMLNDLLVLKSFENKNSKECLDWLDTLIKNHKSASPNMIKNIHKLPSGLKGIIYYKIYDMEKEKIKVITNISSLAIEKLDKTNGKDFTKICKVLGILLDNSIEAAKESVKKIISIDIYDRKESTYLEIVNTANFKDVDIKKINEKHYSSKGKNRGYGLYVVNKIINSSENITLDQKVDKDTFTTILKIQKNK